MNIIVHLFGIGAMISLFLVYQQKSKKKIILCKLSADIFWIAHYFTLGATAGIIPNFVGFFREIVFYNRNSKKWATSPLWVVLFVAVNIGFGIRTFHTWYNVVPIVASCLATIALWSDNPNRTKLMCALASVAFFIYDIFVGSYTGLVSEGISIVSAIICFAKKCILSPGPKCGQSTDNVPLKSKEDSL